MVRNKEYHTLNCIAEQVTLRQEKPDQPVESPFGLLHTTQQRKASSPLIRTSMCGVKEQQAIRIPKDY